MFNFPARCLNNSQKQKILKESWKIVISELTNYIFICEAFLSIGKIPVLYNCKNWKRNRLKSNSQNMIMQFEKIDTNQNHRRTTRNRARTERMRVKTLWRN